MATAVIADDEPMMRAALREHLRALWPELEIRAEAEDGLTALLKIEALRPDVAFLDIRMPGMTGLEVARAKTTASRIVFVTAYSDHAVEAFEADAVDYVVKPVETARLVKVIAKLKRQLAEGDPQAAERLLSTLQRLGVTAPVSPPPVWPQDTRRLDWLQVATGAHGEQVRMVHLQDVLYFESDTKYTRVVAHDCEGLLRLTLKEVLEQTDPGSFVQTHRSTVVNRRFVHAVHRKGEVVEIELKGRGERLKVSVANHHLFRAM
ncbi:LytR/AlgR family response regulator transcription factor [Roseateles sp. NT4]|uniref:LytR/AlgR family response regulator transcription factor n=1 Tax=Roseateles sp. NT4 TaxID=3453715 RepID=UPI003EEA968B